MPQITCQESDTLSSNELTKPPRKSFDGVLQLNTLWCLPCLRDAVREWEIDKPLEIKCYLTNGLSKACFFAKEMAENVIWYSLVAPESLLVKHTNSNWYLLQISQGIRGHVFRTDGLD